MITGTDLAHFAAFDEAHGAGGSAPAPAGETAHSLLPCPFCGHDDPELDEVDLRVYAVCCPDCNAIGPTVAKPRDEQENAGQYEAAAAWNRRSGGTAQLGQRP